MNILIFSNMYLPHLGGVETVVKNLAAELKKRGHRVSIVSSRSSRELKSFEEIDGVEVRRTYLGLPGKTMKSVMVFFVYFLPSLWKLSKILRKEQPDIVNLHFVDSTGFYVLMLKRWFHFPLVASIHGNDVQKFPQESLFLKGILGRVLREAEFVTSCSRSLLEDACRLVPEINSKALVTGNGVDQAEFDAEPDSRPKVPYIFSLGRLERKKGFDILIKAFAAVLSRFPHLHLFLGGAGREEGALRKIVQELKLGERVKFLGPLDRCSVVKFFKGCELFVLPSRIEPLGIVNLEAMAAGKAVVATRVDGVPEIINDGENGLLVESENEGELAAAIIRLLGDGSLRSKMASHNQKVVRERYTWEKVADSYLQAYQGAGESARRG